MKTNFVLQEGVRGQVDNDRGHHVITDLPVEVGGTDQGAKAFELLAMSLNACIGTIFLTVAQKMRVEIEELRIEMETAEEDTIERVQYTLFVKSEAPLQKIERCLELTEKTCPVGVLFHRAGVVFEHKIELL